MQKGFIKTILLIIIAFAILKIVWDFDVLDFLDTPAIRNIWDIFVEFVRKVWNFISRAFVIFQK